MLSKMLSEAVEAVAEDLDDQEVAFLEFVLDENDGAIEELFDLIDGGWDFYEAIDHLGSLMEFKVPSPKEVAARKKKKNRAKSNKNLQKGNPGNNPWSDYGASSPRAKKLGAAGTGGTTMHDVLGKGGRNRTGEWTCSTLGKYQYKCTSNKRKDRDGDPVVKFVNIDGGAHKAYNKRYKAHPHPKKDHPDSV